MFCNCIHRKITTSSVQTRENTGTCQMEYEGYVRSFRVMLYIQYMPNLAVAESVATQKCRDWRWFRILRQVSHLGKWSPATRRIFRFHIDLKSGVSKCRILSKVNRGNSSAQHRETLHRYTKCRATFTCSKVTTCFGTA